MCAVDDDYADDDDDSSDDDVRWADLTLYPLRIFVSDSPQSQKQFQMPRELQRNATAKQSLPTASVAGRQMAPWGDSVQTHDCGNC